MPTHSASLTNLSPANLKENNNVAPSSAGGSAAVITQTANCEHCAADQRKRHSKDSLCRRHVQCVPLSGSEPSNVHHPNNVGLNSVITTIEGSSTTTTAAGTNVTSSLTTNLNLTATRPAATNQLPDRELSQTSAKKIRTLKQCAEHNTRVRRS